MTDYRRTTALVAGLLVIGIAATPAAQERSGGGGGRGGRQTVAADFLNGVRISTDTVLTASVDPLAGPPVAGAPFSGEASTTVTQTLGDGTHIEQRTTAKLYRDSTGRIRREQTIMGLDRLNPATRSQTVITFDSVPGDQMPYILDPEARVATRTSRVRSIGFILPPSTNAPNQAVAATRLYVGDAGGVGRETERASNLLAQGGLSLPLATSSVPADIRPTEEELGTRQMDGVKVTGKRTTTVIPAGRIGNDAPIRITDERWQSPELSITVYSRFSDPRTGVVEYRLTGVNRTEPRADLFTVPSDYTVREAPPGLGGRGRGGRSQ